jgi:quercetin dioxygenase-like cupin family protein
MALAQSLVSHSADQPDEVRPFKDEKGHMDVVHLPSGDAGRGTFEPGWHWAEHVKPIAGTDSCQVHHIGYILSGRMRVRMDDGTETEFGPGDFMHIAPGHDAWVLGDEPCVNLDFGTISGYAVTR